MFFDRWLADNVRGGFYFDFFRISWRSDLNLSLTVVICNILNLWDKNIADLCSHFGIIPLILVYNVVKKDLQSA